MECPHQTVVEESSSPSAVYDAPISLEAARALAPVWAIVATSQDGIVETPFGTYPTKLIGKIMVAARPDTTKVIASPNGLFTVTDVRGVGRFVTATLQSGDALVQARLEAKKAPEVGTRADVSLSPSDVFLFPASGPAS